MKTQRIEGGFRGSPKMGFLPSPSNGNRTGILDEHLFHKIVRMEQKRAVRSHRAVVLLVFGAEAVEAAGERAKALDGLGAVLRGTLRQTDVTGWYEKDASLGVLLTELGDTDPTTVRRTVIGKISEGLGATDGFRWAQSIRVQALVSGNGTGAAASWMDLGYILGMAAPDRAPRPGPRSGRTLPSRARTALWMLCDGLVVLLSAALLAFLWPSHGPADLAGSLLNAVLAALLLPSVAFSFGLHRLEGSWASPSLYRQPALATAVVVAGALLGVLVSDLHPVRPGLFLAQVLFAWGCILTGRFLWLRHAFRAELQRVLDVRRRNVP